MKKSNLLLLSLLFITACYTDDSSSPSLDRLPFEDFSEFFIANNAAADTMEFAAAENYILTTSNNIKFTIPDDAFSETGTLALVIREAVSKADFVLFNLPTMDGATILEASEAVFATPIQGSNPISFDNPISIETGLISNSTAEDMQLYYNENGWNADIANQVTETLTGISFPTSRAAWQMGGKPFVTDLVSVTASATAYSGIPHDVHAFAVVNDQNIIIPLDADVDNVNVSGMVPKGEDFTIVFMAMDHFKLHLGMETINLNQSESVDVRMDLVSPEEMVAMIKNLN